MAEVNVQKRPAQARQEQGLSRRYDPFGLHGGYPSFWRNPFEFLSPFGPSRRLGDDFDQFFGNREANGWWPAIDISEQDGKLNVRADLPGIDKNDVKVEFQDGHLAISGERHRAHEEESGGYTRSERSYGSFYRSIPLPEGANADQARANFKDGVLEVTVPIPESQRKRTIPIEGASGERKQVNTENPSAQRASKAG